MENNIAPLDNDTITRLVYAHDDELTEGHPANPRPDGQSQGAGRNQKVVKR